MSNEIITTANMNEVVNVIDKSAKAGNVNARLVFKLNAAINELKPGKPLSKAEKEQIEMLWDNLIIGFANDAAPVGGFLKENMKSITDAASLYNILKGMHDVYMDVNKGAENEANMEASTIEALSSALEVVLKELEVEDVAELTGVSKDIIAAVVNKEEGAMDKFVTTVKPIKKLALISVASTIIDSHLEVEDDEDEDDNSNDDESKYTEEEIVKMLKNLFDADDAKVTVKHISKPVCGLGCYTKKPKSIFDLFNM